MILACQNIEKSFDGVTILQDASFHIEEREKAALVGINGAGKSTLFRIIVGELSPDNGQVILAKGKTLGYLAQHQEMENELTIYDCLLQVKQHILDMEIRMREMEAEMKHTTGFKRVGISGRRLSETGFHAFRRTENKGSPWPPPSLQTGYYSVG